MLLRLALTALALVSATVAGCGSSTSTIAGSDASVVIPGCRAPSLCYKVNCPCTRDALSGDLCVACDPKKEPGITCDCTLTGSDCLEAAQVCVGRAATPCLGSGARCLPAGSNCMMVGGGTPPQVVSTTTGDADAGPSTEARCPFSDDVCCPGAELDMSVPLNLAGTD